jgi:hypothetical protein
VSSGRRSYVYQTIADIWYEVQRTRTSQPEQILLLCLAGTQAATMTAQASEYYAYAGQSFLGVI